MEKIKPVLHFTMRKLKRKPDKKKSLDLSANGFFSLFCKWKLLDLFSFYFYHVLWIHVTIVHQTCYFHMAIRDVRWK